MKSSLEILRKGLIETPSPLRKSVHVWPSLHPVLKRGVHVMDGRLFLVNKKAHDEPYVPCKYSLSLHTTS